MEMEHGGLMRVAPAATARLWRAASASFHVTLLFVAVQIMYLVVFNSGVLAAAATGDLTKMVLVVASALVGGAAMWMGVVIWVDGDDNTQRYGAAAWLVLAAAFAILVGLVIADGGDLEKFLDIMFKQLEVLIKLFGG